MDSHSTMKMRFEVVEEEIKLELTNDEWPLLASDTNRYFAQKNPKPGGGRALRGVDTKRS